MTVTGTIIKRSTAAATGIVRFRPIPSAAQISGTSVTTAQDTTTTIGGDGTFSQALDAGYYLVFLPGTPEFKIKVLDSTDTVNIVTLVVSTLASTTDFVWNPTTTPVATASVLGLVYLDFAFPTPTVVTVDSQGVAWVRALRILNPATGKYRLGQFDATSMGILWSDDEIDPPT